MGRRQAFAVRQQAERADSNLPGVDEHSFRGFLICREASATKKAMKKRRLDNHACSTLTEGMLLAEYFKNLTAGKQQTNERRSRYRAAGLPAAAPSNSLSAASSLSIWTREPTVMRK